MPCNLFCGLTMAALTLVAGAAPAPIHNRVHLVTNKRADVFAVHLPAASQVTVPASTEHGLVWVAITKGAVGPSGMNQEVAEGAMGCVKGKDSVTLRAPGDTAATFVVVDVLDAFQPLTLSTYATQVENPADPEICLQSIDEALAPGQILQQHSDQNDTLIVAIRPVKLRDVWNLSQDESEGWRPSKPVTIQLSSGAVQWTRTGIHQFRNLGTIPAHFVRIEW